MEKLIPQLSIIVPMYNSSKTIRTCVESVLKQDFNKYELILVDNGSTDNTLEICREYEKNDERITVIPLEYNGGANFARKIGLQIAKAPLIGFVDSDDWIESDMYSNLLKIYEETHCDLISSSWFVDYIEKDYWYVEMDNFHQGLYCDLPKEIYKTMLINENGKHGISYSLWNKIFKRTILIDVYNNVDMRVFYGEDVLVLFSYIMKITSIYITKRAFYHYNIRSGSVCRTADERLSTNSYYLYKGLEKIFIELEDYKYILMKQLRKYILWIEMHTLNQLYNINEYSLGNYEFNYDCIKNKRVILYGAGNISESLYKYLSEECKCNIIAWVDKYYNDKDMKVLHKVLPVNNIKSLLYDYIVIAVLKEELANSIKKELVELYNIDESRIIWNKVGYTSLIQKI